VRSQLTPVQEASAIFRRRKAIYEELRQERKASIEGLGLIYAFVSAGVFLGVRGDGPNMATEAWEGVEPWVRRHLPREGYEPYMIEWMLAKRRASMLLA
jgi:hypothetical protein